MIENPFSKNKEENEKNKQSEESKVDSVSEKKHWHLKARDYILIVMLLILVVGITIFLVYMEMRSRNALSPVEVAVNQILDPNDSGQRFWHVDKVEPSDAKDGLFKITLISNAGNLRYYDNVRSYGLSQSREYLTLVSNESISNIKLIDEAITIAQIPAQKFSSSFGNQVTWNFDNSYYALAVYTDDDTSKTRIWIFDLEGNLVKEIQSSLVVSTDKKSIEPILFSKSSNFILSRTYKELDMEDIKEDGSKYTIAELPIYLTVFNIEGATHKELMVRDYEVSNTTVFYQWNLRDPNYIEYIIHERNEMVDPYQTYLFTAVRI